jgi:peptidoglycan/xylan/chitin deacetylase (PgdA/CDA1 family)
MAAASESRFSLAEWGAIWSVVVVWGSNTAAGKFAVEALPPLFVGGARFAVALSFDSDHETIELRNGGKSYSRLSQGTYGARAGMPRILDILKRHDVPATFFMPAVSAMINEREVKTVVDAVHELGIHSWIHEFNSRLDHATELDLSKRASDVLEKLSGTRPVGMRTASWDFSPYTLKVIRELGLLYDSSLMADEDCYELLLHGEETGVIELPVEWVRDDAVYFSMHRFSSLRPYTPPTDVLDIFRRELDAAWEDGGIFQLTMHPHIIGYRSRIWIVDELIRHAKARGKVWFATHAEVAAYAKAHAA